MDGLTPKQSRALAKWFNSKSVQKMIQEGTLANKRIIIEAVKREGLGVLRRYGPKSARRIKSIRVILKGGPGSGHWGHVGRPGKVGGSRPLSMMSTKPVNPRYFEVGPGRKLIQELPPEAQRAVVSTLTRQKVLNSHLFELERITTDLPRGKSSWIIPDDYARYGYTPGGEALAYYDPRGPSIHLNPDIRSYSVGQVLLHELGHHQEREMIWRQHGDRYRSLLQDDIYPKMRKQVDNAYNRADYGLRDYSFTNASEFVAEVYKVYAAGSISQRDRLNTYFGQWRNPKGTAKLTLDEIFNQEYQEEF